MHANGMIGDNMKIPKLLFIYVFIAFTSLMFSFTLINNNTVTISYLGFGMDSTGILYVGKDSSIEKIKDGKVIETIDHPPARNYAFTIKNDDTILLSTASTVYTLDLSGNIISETEDEGTRTFNQLQRSRKVFTSSDGKKYVVRQPFGRTTVRSSEGETIYQMPLLDYIVELILIGFFLSTCICVPIIIYKWKFAESKSKDISQNSPA